ncbi:MAG: flagellar export chaperone FlgN [Planctomycetota bacterium]
MNSNHHQLDAADVALLVAYLVEEKTSQEGLHDSLEKVEHQVVSGHADDLREELANLKPFLSRMEAISIRRRKVLGHLGAKLGMAPSQIDMDRFVAATPEASRQKVVRARTQLRDLVMRTRRLNGRVNLLIRHMAAFNQDLLRGIFDLEQAPVVYQPNGMTQERSNTNILDRSL